MGCGPSTNHAAFEAVKKEDLEQAKKIIDHIILEKNCGSVLVRLAWQDSGTFDKNIEGKWPAAGGATGSIRFNPEINHGANVGLQNALDIIEPVKAACPKVSYADIIQMAAAEAIRLAGGPKIEMIYGRNDTTSPEQCVKEGYLPDAMIDKERNTIGNPETGMRDSTAIGHLRKVFYRMGFDDEAIVALSGAHTLGRAHKDRSGAGAEKTKYTDNVELVRADGTTVMPRPGGSSWVSNFLVFDNEYFKQLLKENPDEELLRLDTDQALLDDPDFRKYVEKFAEDQDAFFESYAKAHKKLSELGSNFYPLRVKFD